MAAKKPDADKPKDKDALLQAKAELLEQGKKDGKIDARDISAKIPDVPENVELLDALYTELGEANVDITTPEEPVASELSDEWLIDEDEEVVVEDQSYLDDIADDSVRLYLREIGKIPLLNAEEELALAQRVVPATKKPKTRWPKPTCVWSFRLPSATSAAGWTCST